MPRSSQRSLKATYSLLVLLAAALMLASTFGCNPGGQADWEVVAENKGDVPCYFGVAMGPGGGSKADVAGIAKGKPVTLMVGSGDTVVHSVKVVRGGEQTLLMPGTKLPAGKRYLVAVSPDGKVNTAILDK